MWSSQTALILRAVLQAAKKQRRGQSPPQCWATRSWRRGPSSRYQAGKLIILSPWLPIVVQFTHPSKKKTGFLSIFFVNSYIFISYNFKAACLCPLGLQDPCQEESRPELGHLSKICRLLKTQRQGQLRWATCGRRCTSTSRSPEVFPSSPCFQTLYLPLAFSVFAVVLEGNVAD